MAGLGDVELGADGAPVALVGDELEQVKGLEDPAVVGERVAQTGGAAVAGEHADQVVAADLAEGQGAGHAQHVVPVGADAFQADGVAGDGLERAVVGGGVDPPQPGVGDVGDPRGELVAADGEQAEDDVGVGGGVGHHGVGLRAAVAGVDGVEDEQRVAQGSGHDDAAQSHHLVVDDVQPGGALVPQSEVARAAAGVQGLHRHGEAHPVGGGDQPAAQARTTSIFCWAAIRAALPAEMVSARK